MCGDGEMAGFIQRALGYGATGETKEQAWFFLYGRGENGKGVMTDTAAAVLGDYVVTAPPETFLESQAHIRNDLARLTGVFPGPGFAEGKVLTSRHFVVTMV
jgi:putative DNA primase/helicase